MPPKHNPTRKELQHFAEMELTVIHNTEEARAPVMAECLCGSPIFLHRDLLDRLFLNGAPCQETGSQVQ